jgi:hypothetical protein
VNDEKTRHENDLTQLETRLLAAFQDPVTDAAVMARTQRRLREVMVTGATPSRRRLAFAFGPIAATLAMVMVAGVVGWRLVGHRATTEGPVKPSTLKTVPNAAVVDPLNCKLPVVVLLQAGPPGQQRREVGFVDTHSGRYAQDGSASVAGLPGGGFGAVAGKPAQASQPVSYSASLGRWLPVLPFSVSPDGQSYVWTRLLPEGSTTNANNFQKAELHRYDVASATDHTLWTYPGSISPFGWDASGILVETTPPIIRMIPQRGMPIWWLIDPQTGNATQQEIGIGPYYRLTRMPGDPIQNGTFVYSSFTFGPKFQGHPLFRIGSRDPGAPEWVLYETAPGQRVTIYRGTQGDATGFDPNQAKSDATGIWFSDWGGPWLWRWQQGSGLNKLALSGLPSRLAGPNSSVGADPAGPCM